MWSQEAAAHFGLRFCIYYTRHGTTLPLPLAPLQTSLPQLPAAPVGWVCVGKEGRQNGKGTVVLSSYCGQEALHNQPYVILTTTLFKIYHAYFKNEENDTEKCSVI